MRIDAVLDRITRPHVSPNPLPLARMTQLGLVDQQPAAEGESWKCAGRGIRCELRRDPAGVMASRTLAVS